MYKKLFNNKQILITGITGFVGSHLAERLRKEGANVFGISRLENGKGIIQSDIGNYTKLEEIIKNKKIQIIFHLAGESLVEVGQENPYGTFKNNILGTLNILELSRKYGLERVIIASTSHVYGKNKVPYYEGYTPRPSRPYETSKACVDLISTSYAFTYNLPVLIPRFVNIYGPGDLNFTRIIPKTMQSILSGEPVSLWSGKTTRDYLYIDDAIDAYLKLATVNLQRIGSNRIFNIGAGNPVTVSELMEKIIDISGKEVQFKKIDDKRSSEISTQYVSSKKANTILNWKPRVSLDEGLKSTYVWYEKNINSL